MFKHRRKLILQPFCSLVVAEGTHKMCTMSLQIGCFQVSMMIQAKETLLMPLL